MVMKTRSLLKDPSTLLTNPLIRIVKNISRLCRNGREIRKRNIVPWLREDDSKVVEKGYLNQAHHHSRPGAGQEGQYADSATAVGRVDLSGHAARDAEDAYGTQRLVRVGALVLRGRK